MKRIHAVLSLVDGQSVDDVRQLLTLCAQSVLGYTFLSGVLDRTQDQPLFLLQDGARYHTSKAVKAFCDLPKAIKGLLGRYCQTLGGTTA